MKGEGRGTTVVFYGFYGIYGMCPQQTRKQGKETANTPNKRNVKQGRDGSKIDLILNLQEDTFTLAGREYSCITVHEYRIPRHKRYIGTHGAWNDEHPCLRERESERKGILTGHGIWIQRGVHEERNGHWTGCQLCECGPDARETIYKRGEGE